MLIVFPPSRQIIFRQIWKVDPKQATLKRRLGTRLTEMLKCAISDVGRRSLGSLISPSKCRLVASESTFCVVEGHQRAVTKSSTFSFHATPSIEVQVLLKNRTRRLKETEMALGIARRSIAADSRLSRVRNIGITVPLAKQS